MSGPGCRHHPSSLTSDTAALITHPCRPLQRQMVTLCCQDTLHNTNCFLTELLVTCLRTKFEWWNLRTFVFIEKVLANDHIIYIRVRCKIFLTWIMGKISTISYVWSVMENMHLPIYRNQGFYPVNFISIQPITKNLKLWLIYLILVIQKPLSRSFGRE